MWRRCGYTAPAITRARAWVVGHHDDARERQLWRLRLRLRTLVAVFAVWWMDVGYIWRRCRAGVTWRLLPRKCGAVVECVPGPGQRGGMGLFTRCRESWQCGGRRWVDGIFTGFSGILWKCTEWSDVALSPAKAVEKAAGRCYSLHRNGTTSFLCSLWWQEAICDVTALAEKMPCVLCNGKLTPKHWDVNLSSVSLFSSKMDLETFWCWTPGYGR